MHSARSVPIYVDLDGTLIHTDILAESAVQFASSNPLLTPMLAVWLLRGKACLKAELARRTNLDVSLLPYNRPLIAHLRERSASGVPVRLATAANEGYANAVAKHLGFFSEVLASNSVTNLSGSRKLIAIQQTSGGPFVYAGNDEVDMVIWKASSGAIVVDASRTMLTRIEAAGTSVVATFARPLGSPTANLRAIRPYQWLKNLLVFLPILPIANELSTKMLVQALLAFVAFSFCASAIYIVNDLADLEHDRLHPTKRLRPFAAGLLPLQHGLVAAPLLLAISGVIAVVLGPLFTLALAAYIALSLSYTLALKRYALIDVLSLAMLYTLRVLGGAAAILVAPSFWILAFSMFLFFSLALAKRYVELDAMLSAGRLHAAGRGYHTSDMPALQTMGISAGYLAVLVVALYINSPDVTGRYGHGPLLWGLCPLLMLWVSRIWLKAIRSEMDGDPLVFALKDGFGLLLAGTALLLLLAAIRF